MSDAGQSSEQAVAATTAVAGINRNKLIRYALFFIVMGLYTLPLLGVVVNPPSYLANSATGQLTLLVIHEFAGFIFVGHTLFSNIWAMRIRMYADHQTGVMARAMLRKMALGITMPTSIILPLAGLMLVNGYFGGFEGAPWARDAYIAFWLMAALQLVPDLIRYAVDTHAADPKRDVRQAAYRGIATTFVTIYIIFVMITKVSIFSG